MVATLGTIITMMIMSRPLSIAAGVVVEVDVVADGAAGAVVVIVARIKPVPSLKLCRNSRPRPLLERTVPHIPLIPTVRSGADGGVGVTGGLVAGLRLDPLLPNQLTTNLAPNVVEKIRPSNRTVVAGDRIPEAVAAAVVVPLIRPGLMGPMLPNPPRRRAR
jgi:hypothetical protein